MALLLESFDAPAPEAPGPSADWLLGQAAGLAEGIARGRAEAEAEGARLSRELAQALQETAFAYAEARAQVLASLGPLVALLADRLLPPLAAEAVGPWLREAVLAAARADSAQPLALHVHPDRLAAVRACLPPGAAARLCADPALGPHGARLSFASRETELDLDACLAALREALSALRDPAEPPLDQKARHG